MGLFGKRRDPAERGMEIANKVASGKGFYGRATKAFAGADNFARIQQSVNTMNEAIDVQQLVAAGAPTTQAVVTAIADTGGLINHNPVVDLIVQLRDTGAPLQLRTMVSKLEIPRAGDQVLLVADPRVPGAFLYAGVART
jgi:hypothetical protein